MADELLALYPWLWLLVAITLLVRLRVFSPQPLRAAPNRASALSLQLFAAVFLLYIGTAILTQSAFIAFFARHAHAAPTTSSQPASLPATTPATLPALTTLPTPPLPPTISPTTEPASSQPAFTIAPQDFSLQIAQQLVVAIGELPACIVVLLLARKLVAGGIDGFGLSLRKFGEAIPLGILGLIIIYPVLIAIGSIVAPIFEHFAHRQEEIHPTLQMLSQHPTGTQKFFLILFASIAAPVLEEIGFRGLLQSVLTQRRWGLILPGPIDPAYTPSPAHRWGAIAITAFLFALSHGMPEHIPVLFTLALALGYLYERTGNLWASIILHASFNALGIYFALHS